MTTDTCVALPDFYVVNIGTAPIGLDNLASTITLSPNQMGTDLNTYYVNRPPGLYFSLKPGTKVELKVWNGRATGVMYGKDTFRLYDNPYDIDDLREAGGISLGALGIVLLAIHPPMFLRRKLSQQPAEDKATRWKFRDGLASKLGHDRHMRIALVVFTIAQLLDVLTSIRGGRVGLYEGNPVASMLIENTGATITFLLLKVAGIAAIVLVVARLPRRPALIVTWAASAVFFYVALHNVGLIHSVQHPV
jgi:hypothetical protein